MLGNHWTLNSKFYIKLLISCRYEENRHWLCQCCMT